MNFVKSLGSIPLPKKVFFLVMLIFGCIFYTTLIGNHYYFRTYAFDYGVYNFALWDYAHFHISTISSFHVFHEGPINFMQDHFSLTLWYFVPVYWLLNWLTGSYTLLIILGTLILWSGWAIYKLIKLKTNDEWLSVLSVLYYFLLQGRYCAFSSDSNILIIICCFVPLFLLYFEMKKYVIAFILLILLLFSREDMPIWFVFIFIVIGTWHWKDKKVLALCLGGILTCVVYFIILFKVFIPMWETPDKPYTLFQYSVLGKTPLQALMHCFEHPIETFKLLYVSQSDNHIYNDVKKEFYLVYLISGGFVLFFRPQYFIWFIPLIAQKMFNDDEMRWGINGYYAIAVVTLLPVSVFLIISKLRIKWIRYTLALIVCILSFLVTKYEMTVTNRAIPWGNTTKENVFDPNFFHPNYNSHAIHKALKQIPSNSKICASSSILPHLTQRQFAYEYPDLMDADYIAIFTYRDFYNIDEETYLRILNEHVFSSTWQVINYSPPFILLEKNQPISISNKSMDSLECGAETITQDKMHFISSNGELLDDADARDSVVKRTGKYSIRLNKEKQFGFTYHGTNMKTGDFLRITVWKYPASNDTGSLMVSTGNRFSKVVSSGKKRETSGWEQLEINVVVPENHSGFEIYVTNSSKTSIWFDDLKIVKCSVK